MKLEIGDHLCEALQMSDDDDRPGRLWRVCAYPLERVTLDASAYVALDSAWTDLLMWASEAYGPTPVGHARVDISLSSGCDFIETDHWQVALETADGEPIETVQTICISPRAVYHTFTVPVDALPGIVLRRVTYHAPR